MSVVTKRIVIGVVLTGVLGVGVIAGVAKSIDDAEWKRTCDGITITGKCQDDSGSRYSKYIFHEVEPEVTKTVNHPAEPAKTHTVHHPAEYGTHSVPVCIKTTIGYKNGTCALSRCRDGEYSGSTGRGTCSYHGGVWYGGGPWYKYVEEQYLISAAWDEIIVDVPAKDAWTETIIVTPARDAWIKRNWQNKKPESKTIPTRTLHDTPPLLSGGVIDCGALIAGFLL